MKSTAHEFPDIETISYRNEDGSIIPKEATQDDDEDSDEIPEKFETDADGF